MTRMVLFDKPIWLVSDPDTDIRNIVEIYGFSLPNDVPICLDNIDCYLDYMCGASRWDQDDNDRADKDYWEENCSGLCHFVYDISMIQYYHESWKLRQISYKIYETDKDLDIKAPGMYDDKYIRSRRLRDEIKETWKLVDVNAPDGSK